jgi:hypothetical protein
MRWRRRYDKLRLESHQKLERFGETLFQITLLPELLEVLLFTARRGARAGSLRRGCREEA